MCPGPTIRRRGIQGRAHQHRLALVFTALIISGLALTGCGSGSGNRGSSAQTSSSASAQASANSVTALINTGIAQANARQYPQAETTFRDVLVLSPRNKFAWYNLGLLAQVQNRPSAAIADYTEAVGTDPNYTPAMYNKAILLEGTNPHSALALYERITSINPKAATAFLRESFVYTRLGDKVQAAQARARAVALDSRLKTITTPAQTTTSK